MSRRVNPKVSVQPSDKLSAEVTKLRREQQAETKADATSNRADSDAVGSRGSKSGVSDSAVSHDPGAGPDNLASKGDSTSGRGTGGEGASGVVAAAPTGAHGAVTQAQDALGAQFGGGAITEHGRAEVDVEEVIADARGSLPMGQGREAANSMLFDDAARGDGTTGIAEMGSDGISQDPTALLQQSELLQDLERVYGSNYTRGDAMTLHFERVTPGGNQIFETDGGMRISKTTDGKTVIRDPRLGTTTVVEKDGSSTTANKKNEVTETPAPPAETPAPPADPSQPGVKTPDPEGGDERFRFVGEGLKERLGPKGVDGDGDIDFGDDIPFGVGAGAVLPDQRDALLGDAGRAGGVVEGPATSGGGALDPTGNAGAIDYLDETPFGGGLEDDPLAGSGPRREFDDARRSDDDDEDTEEDDDADTFAKGGDDPA